MNAADSSGAMTDGTSRIAVFALLNQLLPARTLALPAGMESHDAGSLLTSITSRAAQTAPGGSDFFARVECRAD